MVSKRLLPKLFEVNESRCNLSSSSIELNFNEACLFVSSTASKVLTFLGQSSECYECDLLEWAQIPPMTTVPILVKSDFEVYFELKDSSSNNPCSYSRKFGERGIFSLNATDDPSKCGNLVTLQEPDDATFPLLILIVILGCLQIGWIGLQYVMTTDWYLRLTTKDSPSNELENDLGSPSTFIDTTARTELQQAVQKQKARVKSLDTFRGICIVLMIFVNFGGGSYMFMKHTTWNGLTVADVLFPSFMWIMGLSMALSLRSQLRSGVTRRQLALRSVKRGLKLIVIGAVLNSSHGKNDLATYRIPGVLQRLGLSYIIVSLIEVFRMKLQSRQQPNRLLWLQDIGESWLQWFIVLALAGVHTAITFALPVPGCPTGYTGPGGLHMHGQYKNCTGGATGYIDKLVFGTDHIYQHPTAQKWYFTEEPYDPEGLLGNLTAVLLVYFGVQAGRIMLTYSNPWSRMIRWVIWGILTGLVGAILCGFSKEDGVIPVNKNLYSLSFVLVNSSIDFIFLAFLYFIVDVKHLWSGSPFYFTGMNSLLVYILHGFTGSMLPWRWQPLGMTHAEVLFMDAWAVALWVISAYYWFRRNFFFTV